MILNVVKCDKEIRGLFVGEIDMADIKNSAVELIGNTPILKLNRYTKASGVENANILAKLEVLESGQGM